MRGERGGNMLQNTSQLSYNQSTMNPTTNQTGLQQNQSFGQTQQQQQPFGQNQQQFGQNQQTFGQNQQTFGQNQQSFGQNQQTFGQTQQAFTGQNQQAFTGQSQQAFSGQNTGQSSYGSNQNRIQHKGIPQVIPTVGQPMGINQQQQQQQQQQQPNTAGPNLMQKLNEITAPGGDILSKGKELIFMKFGLGGK